MKKLYVMRGLESWSGNNIYIGTRPFKGFRMDMYGDKIPSPRGEEMCYGSFRKLTGIELKVGESKSFTIQE